ncbi:MAG: site-specific integrase, partial [Rhodopirellula sp.]|nr:site-specific integrase [Rhodopirellula sp.]
MSARLASQPLEPDTTAWVASLPDEMHAKLAETGLFGRRGVTKLGPFLRSIIDEREDLKPNTRRNWLSAINHLVEFFGDEANLLDVTPGEADRFWQWMFNKGLGESTVSREVKRARQFFRVAVRRRLVPENPFTDIPTPAQVNADRQHYVTIEAARLLLDECRSPSQRLTIALARFAGLRIPSELVGLLWSEVNWERERFTVHAPKTERQGKGIRVVPIFPELAPYLR